jgi:hypothetical protein
MSKPDYIPGTDGWSADEWAEADPHAHPAAGERQTWGEHTLDEYSAQWARDEAAQKERERWALQFYGE